MEKTIVINNDKFIIRPFNEKDENKVLSLWKVAFDKDMPIPIWKWKYIDNPFNQNILLCINKDNLVCVMYGGIPYFANFGGKLIEITQLMDIMSHPDYRKTGLFIHSANAFFDYFGCPERSSILYGFPGKYHFAIGEKYLKYEKIKPSVCYLKLHTSDLLTNQKAQKTKFGFKIKKVNKIDSSFDKLWNNYHTFYPLSVIRDAKFLNWRFMKHPFNKYEIWVYKNFISGNLKAYVILSRKDNKKVSIVDMLFPSSAEVVNDFFTKFVKVLYDQHIEIIETWLPSNHFMIDLLKSIYFKSFTEPIGIIPTVRVFDPEMTINWVSKSLYYTMADADLL
jgi:hypothetical protein